MSALRRLVGVKRKCCERHQFDAPDPIVAHRAQTGGAAPQREVAPVPTIAAPAQTANQIDDWIPPHIIQYCYGTDPSQMLPGGGRRVGMLAIGKCLKTCTTPSRPPRISPHSSRNSKNGVSRRHVSLYQLLANGLHSCLACGGSSSGRSSERSVPSPACR
jgi:hypothetical protein